MYICVGFCQHAQSIHISGCVKLCKMQKSTNFTHFAPKIFYISLSKTVYIYTFTAVTVHIVIVDVYLIILLISHSHLFFSLFSVHNKLSDFSSPHLLFPQIHTNTSTQTNQHKYTQTNPHRQTNRETDCCLTGMISACGSTGMGFEAACGRDDA